MQIVATASALKGVRTSERKVAASYRLITCCGGQTASGGATGIEQEQVASKASDAAQEGGDLGLEQKLVAVSIQHLNGYLAQLSDVFSSRSVDDMDSMGKVFVVPVLYDFGLELLRSQVLEGGNVILDSHGEDFGVLDDVDFQARRQRSLCWCRHARSGLLGWSILSSFLLWRRRTVFDFDQSRSCGRVVVSKVVKVVEVADHQLHNLRVLAGIFGIIRFRVRGFELDLAGLALLV